LFRFVRLRRRPGDLTVRARGLPGYPEPFVGADPERNTGAGEGVTQDGRGSSDRRNGSRGSLQIFAGILVILSQIRELLHVPFVDQIFNNTAKGNRMVVIERDLGPRVQFSGFDRFRELKFRHRDLCNPSTPES